MPFFVCLDCLTTNMLAKKSSIVKRFYVVFLVILWENAMYLKFERLLKERNVTAYKVGKATGIPSAVFSDWKNGKYTPKQERIQKIADYFGVPVSYFYGEEEKPQYYLDDETVKMAQELHDNPDLRAMFKATRNLSPKDIATFTKLIKGYRGDNE